MIFETPTSPHPRSQLIDQPKHPVWRQRLESDNQCPAGTRTRPATRHFFYTRPDSVSENPEATRILKYPVLSNIPGKSEVWGTPRHEKGNQKKSIFLHTTFKLGFNEYPKNRECNRKYLRAEREKVHHRGIGAESRSRALWADPGLYTRNYRAIVSKRGPEYAREWQWEPLRARVGVRESHREPERARERQGENQR